MTGELSDRSASIVRIRRGAVREERTPRGEPLARRDGTLEMDAVRRSLGDLPSKAPPEAGLIPLGALAQPGGRAYAWQLNERDRLWADEISSLTESAAADQWDATTDIPWDAVGRLPDHVERAWHR